MRSLLLAFAALLLAAPAAEAAKPYRVSHFSLHRVFPSTTWTWGSYPGNRRGRPQPARPRRDAGDGRRPGRRAARPPRAGADRRARLPVEVPRPVLVAQAAGRHLVVRARRAELLGAAPGAAGSRWPGRACSSRTARTRAGTAGSRTPPATSVVSRWFACSVDGVASSTLAGAGVAARRPESPEQRASRRGSGWWMVARGSGGRVSGLLVLAAVCRETGKVRATETVGDRARIGSGRWRPVSNTIARSSGRVRGGRQLTLPRRRSTGTPPGPSALTRAANRSRMTGPDGAVLGPRP